MTTKDQLNETIALVDETLNQMHQLYDEAREHSTLQERDELVLLVERETRLKVNYDLAVKLRTQASFKDRVEHDAVWVEVVEEGRRHQGLEARNSQRLIDQNNTIIDLLTQIRGLNRQ